MFEVSIATFALGLLSIFLLIWSLPIMSQLFETSVRFLFRDRSYESFSFTDYFNSLTNRGDCFPEFLGSVIIGAILLVVGVEMQDSTITVNLLWVLILAIPHTLRLFIDICRSLKINHKTGDAERIEKLEKELNKLKGDKEMW
ncbi:hypothetical protein [Vibrio phage RYC]|nr:hypothetical protein [Vibrio phage RYC]